MSGVVTETGTVPLIGTPYYAPKDKTGAFTVITSAEMPEVGDSLRVTVRLRSVAELAGARFGLHLVEMSR